MENKKKLFIDILYLIGFIGLISIIFTSLAYIIFIGGNGEFDSFYNMFNWIILSYSVVTIGIIITNFFLKKKFNWIEIVLFLGGIILIIVFAVLSKGKYNIWGYSTYFSIYQTYLMEFFSGIATFVLLLATKIIKMFCWKDKNKEVKNEEK